MLLRRISKHVSNQNWFAVFLDFIIVVVGVFIGIQVANWNEARLQQQLGEQYVQRLLVDLENDLESSQAMASYYGEVVENIEAADQLLAIDDSDAKVLVLSAYRASEIMFTPPKNATWTQIVSSGHLGLIPDAALNEGLLDYYSFSETTNASYEALRASIYRNTIRSIIPLAVQKAIRAGCSDKLDERLIVIGFVDNCELNLSQDAIDETAVLLRNDVRIKNLLHNQYTEVITEVNNYLGNVVAIKQALNNLRKKGLQ
ncbi:MAG: DUF6090 family protein [Proteobacteria bacterium]|nr:DUF6090 family protein [Pseudomonadota bacterium]